jgi:hypothetical protein
MTRAKTFLLILFISTVVGLAACSDDVHVGDDGSADIPIRLEIPAGHVQAKVGLSGFIFGTFIMVNAYFLIIAGIIILVIRDKAANTIISTIKMAVQMMNPTASEGGFIRILDMLSQNDRRVQIGTIGIVIGIILAYFGAWIAT